VLVLVCKLVIFSLFVCACERARHAVWFAYSMVGAVWLASRGRWRPRVVRYFRNVGSQLCLFPCLPSLRCGFGCRSLEPMAALRFATAAEASIVAQRLAALFGRWGVGSGAFLEAALKGREPPPRGGGLTKQPPRTKDNQGRFFFGEGERRTLPSPVFFLPRRRGQNPRVVDRGPGWARRRRHWPNPDWCGVIVREMPCSEALHAYPARPRTYPLGCWLRK